MTSCPKCRNEIAPVFQFCPSCGAHLSSSLNCILLARLFNKVEPGKGVHSFAQKRLWTLGKELGFYSIVEYRVPDLTKEGRASYIDVVWKSRDGIECAFEIRRKKHDLNLVTTVKDTDKLQNLVANKKFVVNVSEMTGRAYFCLIPDAPPPLASERSPKTNH